MKTESKKENLQALLAKITSEPFKEVLAENRVIDNVHLKTKKYVTSRFYKSISKYM